MAVLVEPERPWRVITSDKHSTVWDGRETLFEFNFQAFGISADECFAFATEAEANPRELRPGKERKAGSPEHYSVERNNVYRRAANNSGMLNLVPANDNEPLIAVAA
jgi:hypothetical protein